MKMKTQHPKPIGFSKSSAKKFHSNTSLHKKQEKNHINNLTLHIKQLQNEEMKNPKVVEGKKSWK